MTPHWDTVLQVSRPDDQNVEYCSTTILAGILSLGTRATGGGSGASTSVAVSLRERVLVGEINGVAECRIDFSSLRDWPTGPRFIRPNVAGRGESFLTATTAGPVPSVYNKNHFGIPVKTHRSRVASSVQPPPPIEYMIQRVFAERGIVDGHEILYIY